MRGEGRGKGRGGGGNRNRKEGGGGGGYKGVGRHRDINGCKHTSAPLLHFQLSKKFYP